MKKLLVLLTLASSFSAFSYDVADESLFLADEGSFISSEGADISADNVSDSSDATSFYKKDIALQTQKDIERFRASDEITAFLQSRINELMKVLPELANDEAKAIDVLESLNQESMNTNN